MLWSTRRSSSRCVIAAFCQRKRSDLVLQIDVAPQANLAHVVAGASEAALAANFAAAKFVVLVGIGDHVRLGDESFTHAAQKLQADPDEAPEAEPANWSRRFVRRIACLGGGLLVLGFFVNKLACARAHGCRCDRTGHPQQSSSSNASHLPLDPAWWPFHRRLCESLPRSLLGM